MKIEYISPFLKNADGAARKFLIPLVALKTYQKRDAALAAMFEMGGIHADPTPEFLKQRSKMMAATCKLQREGWFCETV